MIPDYFRAIRRWGSRETQTRPGANPRFAGSFSQAGDRARTGDIQLGRLALYQLSYTRVRLA